MTPGEIEALIEAMIERKLRELFAPLTQQSENDEWADANEAAQQLGLPSKQALYNAITAGLLRTGKEVRDRRLPGRKKPRYQFHIPNCRKRLDQPPEKRKVV
ncbi:MAG TPA: hypothetical protein V6D10_07420 [Trichocoleus sp.]|jgi:hypothetical protein